MNVKHNFGDTIYIPRVTYHQALVTCPVCAGKLLVTLIDGYGKSWSIGYSACHDDALQPTGKISKLGMRSEVVEQKIYAIDLAEGTVNSIPSDQVFPTWEAAEELLVEAKKDALESNGLKEEESK